MELKTSIIFWKISGNIFSKLHGAAVKIIFLGVGEAFDETLPNNAHLVLSDTKLLLDCGYNVPGQVWKYNPDQSFLDATYISHTHADHYFGIPPLLTRMLEEERRKPLTIIAPRGSKQTVEEIIEYGYRGVTGLYQFRIDFLEAAEGQTIKLNELELSFALTEHPERNHAIKVRTGKRSVCYSGDGMFRRETERLYRNADLLIHEAYTFDKKIPNHACAVDVIEMAKRNNIRCLALTHLQRDFRKSSKEMLKKDPLCPEIEILIPEPRDEYSF